MRILLSPQRRDGALDVVKSGDTITVNGALFDFSYVIDGEPLSVDEIDSKWIVGPVKRVDGVLHVTLLLPHGPNPSQAVAFPQPITVTQDGPVSVPRDPEPELEEGE